MFKFFNHVEVPAAVCGDVGASGAVLRQYFPRSTVASVSEPSHVCSVSTDDGASQEVW